MPEALSVPIILWHPDGKRVARQGSAWPTLKLAPDQELTAQLRAAWQVESWLLHDGGLAYGVTGSPRFEGLGETLPAGLSWQEAAVPELRLARPWHQLGWPAKAQALLREAGLSGTLRQVSSSDLNTVLRVETPQGTAYLKKSHSPREMQATAHLERHFPDLGPKVLGLSETENWQILASGGALLDSVGDLGAWAEALERLATFQTSAKAQAWAALGCPDAEQVLHKAIPLALLHRAAVYDQQFRNWQGSIADWRPNYTPYYLRLAAGELGRLTPTA